MSEILFIFYTIMYASFKMLAFSPYPVSLRSMRCWAGEWRSP